MYGVDSNIISQGYGQKLVSQALKYITSKGYESIYCETTSLSSESVMLKLGGKIHKSYYFRDLEAFYSAPRNPNDILERLSLVYFIFEPVVKF